MSAVTFLYSTAPDEKTAAAIADALVGSGAAACVNIIPGMRSVYCWEGKVASAAEVVLIVKTTADASSRAIATIKSLHPYELPAIAALSVDEIHSSRAFCDWVRSSCASG